jgi:hypothetical protein
LLSEPNQSQMQVASVLNCWISSSDVSGYHAEIHEGHGTVGAGQGHGMACVKAQHGMGTACYVWISLKTFKDIEAGLQKILYCLCLPSCIICRSITPLKHYVHSYPPSPPLPHILREHVCFTNWKQGYVLGKFQCGLTSMDWCCDLWNVKIYDDDILAIYFSCGHELEEPCLPLTKQSIPCVNHVKYFYLITGVLISP